MENRRSVVLHGLRSADFLSFVLCVLHAAADSVAKVELSMIGTRVKSDMKNAKAKGMSIGRPGTTKADITANFYKHFPAYAAGPLNISELARVCGLSRTTVYKYLKMVSDRLYIFFRNS